MTQKTAQQLEEALGLPTSGSTARFSRVSAHIDATSDAVVFATDEKTLREACASAAGMILAPTTLAPTTPAPTTLAPTTLAPEKIFDAGFPDVRDIRILSVADPRWAFAVVARELGTCVRSAELRAVHPTAEFGAGVHLGRGTTVGAHVVIEQGVQIGGACRIGPRVTILRGTTLGDRVVVQPGAVLGSAGFGYVRHPETGEYLAFPQIGTLAIENDVEIGANTTIDRGALGETRIGAGTKIDNLVHIAHNCQVGRNVVIAAQTGISGSSTVEDGAVIAGQVGIADHVTIGPGVILGAQAGVPTGKRIRGPGEIFWGTPARPIREYLRDLARLRRG